MKILHFADIHAQGPTLEEVKKCCCFLLEQARKENPDLIIFAGDAFESAEVRLDSAPAKFMFWLFSELACVAPIVAITGTPSHDGRAAEVFEHIRAAFPIHVTADAPEQLLLMDGEFLALSGRVPDEPTDRPDAIISAFPAPSKKWFQSPETIQGSEKAIAQELSKLFAHFSNTASDFAAPHILVGHWNVTGAYVSGRQTLTGVDIEVSRDQMELADADLVCLGHIHLRQQIGENIFFAGSTQNNTWGEMHEAGFWIHDVKKGGLAEWSRFIETPTTKMIDMSCDATAGQADDLDMILYTYNKDEYEGSRVRLTIKAFADEAEKLDVPGIKAFFESVNAQLDLQLIRVPRENVRSQRILELDRLYDKIEENARILEETIPPGIREKAERLEAGDTDKLLEEVRAL